MPTVEVEKNYKLFVVLDDEKVLERLIAFTAAYCKITEDLEALYRVIGIFENDSYRRIFDALPPGKSGRILEVEANDWLIFLSGLETADQKKAILRSRLDEHSARGTESGMQAQIDRITQDAVTISSANAGEMGFIVGRTQPCKTSGAEYVYLGIKQLVIITGTNNNAEHYSTEMIKEIILKYLVPVHVPVLINISEP